MREDRFQTVSEDDVETILEHQIEVYKNLQKNAFRVLRLIIGIVAVTIALGSAILSGVINTPIRIGPASYYIDRTLQKDPSGEFTALALLILLIIGLIFCFFSLLFAMSGIISSYNVLMTGGIYPYLPQRGDQNLRLVFTDAPVTEADLSRVKLNNLTLAHMNDGLSRCYKHLGISFVALLFGSTAIVAVYFAETKLATYISLSIIAMFFIISLPKLIEAVTDEPTRTKEVDLRDIENRLGDLKWPVLSTIVFIFVILPLVAVLILLGRTTVLAILSVGFVVSGIIVFGADHYFEI